MAIVNLNAGSVPYNTGYPGDLQGMLDLSTNYLYVNIEDTYLQSAYVSSDPPPPSEQNRVWFQISQDLNTPVSIRVFLNGKWQYFGELSFGDMVLCSAQATVTSPWGDPNMQYYVDGVFKMTPSAPPAPTNYKYKCFVGYY